MANETARWRRGLTLELANDLPQALVFVLEAAVFGDDGFHEIQHFADDFADAGVSQGIHVQAKLLHVFSEVGGTHDTGILCLHSLETVLHGMLAPLAIRRILKNRRGAETQRQVLFLCVFAPPR